MFIQKLKKSLKKMTLSLLLAVVVVVNMPNLAVTTASPALHDKVANTYTVYAAGAGDTPATTPSTTAKNTMQSIKDTVEKLLQVRHFLDELLWPVLYAIGQLMDNNLLFSGGMGQRLLDIWVPIRNIVNIFFVIALVGIALYNVLGIGEDGGNYSIKSALPKMIVGIIAVNFSFMGMKVILDAVNIMTTAIFALPAQVSAGATPLSNPEYIHRYCANYGGMDYTKALTTAELEEAQKALAFRSIVTSYGVSVPAGEKSSQKIGTLCSTIADSTDKTVKVQPKDTCAKAITGWKGICKGLELSETDAKGAGGKALFAKIDHNNIALALAINMGQVVYYPQLYTASDATDMGPLMVGALFGICMYVIYAASFIALLVVLLARLVVMWLSIAVSPILVITYAIPAVKENLGGFSEISEKFVKHVMAPIPIAFSLSIGWIMLNAMKVKSMGAALTADNSPITLDWTKIPALPVQGLSTLQELVVAVGAIAIVWLGVFTSAGTTLAAPVTDFIKGKLQSAGKFLATAPLKYTPFIPIGGGKYSMSAVSHFLDRAEQRINEPDTSLTERPDLQKWLSKSVDLTKISGKIKNNDDLVKTILNEKVKAQVLGNNPEMKTQLKNIQKNSSVYRTLTPQSKTALDQYITEIDSTDEKVKGNAGTKFIEGLKKNKDSLVLNPYSDAEIGAGATTPASKDEKPAPEAGAHLEATDKNAPAPKTDTMGSTGITAAQTSIGGATAYVDADGNVYNADKKKTDLGDADKTKYKQEIEAAQKQAKEVADKSMTEAGDTPVFDNNGGASVPVGKNQKNQPLYTDSSGGVKDKDGKKVDNSGVSSYAIEKGKARATKLKIDQDSTFVKSSSLAKDKGFVYVGTSGGESFPIFVDKAGKTYNASGVVANLQEGKLDDLKELDEKETQAVINGMKSKATK